MEEMDQDPLYLGEYRHNLDAKNRVTIPAKWRFRGDDTDVYMAWVHPEGYVSVCPPARISEFRKKMRSIPESDTQGQRIMRRLFGRASQFGCDRQGRIKLESRMVSAVGLEKKLVLVGLGETFNIWSADRFVSQDEEEFDLLEAMKAFGI